MVNYLENLQIKEIAFCKKGMNPHAKIALFKSADEENADPLGTTPLEKGNPKLSDKTPSVEELTKSLEDLTKALEVSKVETEELSILAKMSDVEKMSMDGMSEEEKKKFLAMSPEERKMKMAEMKKSDETIVVDGETISKSAVGEANFAFAKRLAAAEEAIAKANETAELAVLEKRAAAELSHLSGTDADKAKVLKAVYGMPEVERKFVEGILKKADELASADFEKVGKSAGDKPEDDVSKRVEKLADELVKAENISKSAAIAKVWTSHPEFYAEYKGAE